MFVLSGGLLSFYFPVYIINRMADVNKGKTLSHHIALAISIGLIWLSFMFKIQRWPASAELLIAGCGMFAIFLLLLLIYKMKQKLPQNFKIIYVAGFIGALLLSMGVLFKAMHWPGVMVLLVSGAGILFVIYFPMYIFNFSDNVEDSYLYLRDIFFALIIGSIITFYMVRDMTHDDAQKAAQQEILNEQLVPRSGN